MEKWEYLTRFFVAKTDKDTKTFIKNRFGKNARANSPEAMIPELDKLGEEGWEMVHMEPVARVGGNEDVLFDADYRWSSTYFCVLKRRKPDSWIPVASYRPPETQG